MNLRLTMAAALAALLGGCMGGEKLPPLTRPQLNVFISPAGEPFRARDDGAYPVVGWFARADANADGAIDRAELEADSLAFFKVVDTNGDDVINAFELGDYEQKIAPEILPRVAQLTARDIPALPNSAEQQRETHTPTVGRLGGRPGGARLYGATGEYQPVASADADFDGKVSRAEAVAASQRRFGFLDKDKDGRLVRAELMSPAERLWAKAPLQSR